MPTVEAVPASPARPSLAAGGPQFRLGRRFLLVRGPDALAGLGLLGWDPLDLGCDLVERTREAHALPLCLVCAGRSGLLQDGVGVVEAFAEGCVDLLVRHLDPEAVSDSLEHELTGHRGCGLLSQPCDEILGG